MAISGSIQSGFLDQIKQRIPPNVSMADDLADVLNLSRDSVYRRIRGETILSLDEIGVLCRHYSVSLDALLSQTADTVGFRYQVVSYSDFTFEHWLRSIESNLQLIISFPEKDKELVFYAKDVPVFYYFNFPQLAAFKMFFWMKTVLGYPQYQAEKFSMALVPDEYLAIGTRIWEQYAKIPSTELWSDENVLVTLKQIEYFHECGYFSSPEEALKIIDDFAALVRKISEWATKGTKDGKTGDLRLYKNEILIAENTILFKMGMKRVIFLTHNIIDILTTSHEVLCKRTEQFLNTLLNKAIPISITGEKERFKFFSQMEEKIQSVRLRIKASG
jgi:hypothetical protein